MILLGKSKSVAPPLSVKSPLVILIVLAEV
jgi:hypothetical protein